jgi:hypothetical protein
MGATVKALPVDHTPAVTAPNLVVDLLLEVASATLKANQK